MDMVFKAVDIAKADIGDAGQFAGYASTFGTLDSYGDIVERGAFSASLAEWSARGRLPKMLASHGGDTLWPCGVWESMREDGRGLRVSGRLATKTTAGAEAFELMKMGALDGLSVGCVLPRDGAEWVEHDGRRVRSIKRLDLWEISLVTFPACPDARIDIVKSRRDVETILRGLGISERTARKMSAMIPPDGDDETQDAIEAFSGKVHSLLGI